MRPRCTVGWIFLALLACSLVGVLACSPETATPEAARSGADAARAVGGMYETTGTTIDLETGSSRPIHGRVVLQIQDDRFTTHFELQTTDPGTRTSAARAIGTGEGRVDGAHLRGTAEVQLVMGMAPGVDVGFAFVPREVSIRIDSRAQAEFFPDGTVRIELENAGVPGSGYSPTKTLLVGYPKAAPGPR